ncbi:ankyrin [Setomelanomma holmii]|uniref:Ankyrin n=1 Tax=Setomelanomma holmii TaxID=210430 RepID=A0A9P4GW97_9PLEO|nr:ankyrin [Setomelanomma holmii]
MATQASSPIGLPSLPADHDEWIPYVVRHPETPLDELLKPYKQYDSKLREIFAQQPDHPAIHRANAVPIFAGHEQELKVRARDLAVESEAERQRYLMPLKKPDRRPSGAPAVVQTLKEFQTNFQLFSESSLVDMDWSNVVVAGSAVVTSLLPVPEKQNASKRALREYYHQQLAPASDVDLFLYGLTEDQAVEKIKQIEQRIRDSILTETTTIRTKNAITIASQYPTRHVQIVLRIYRSISEILTGFDVDCSCAAYDGKQVYASPRALVAYMTQVNTIDLTRRSPSYENRLSKYSRRGFEVYWPLLDRSRIDPTLFERSFGRTLGLARLLVLEKLPKNTDREAYVDQRRAERGRPTINRWASRKLKGNMKEEHDDEVAEWVETDEVSDYHTFTIPYGPKYHARKIERLLYAKDLLLNAEWNRPKERDTTLHRHPAFFGNADDVIKDCCGYCPQPNTAEDNEIAEEESKIYVSGGLTFIKDNPGRQAIGSFNPLTDDDWTEMAYVGNTARLCQAIVDGDLEHVQDWLNQEGADVNSRDYTGRTPLHLAVTSSTPEIVQCLIEAGARIVARVFDGKTALHLAAMRGEAVMVKALLAKSEANEEKEADKQDTKRKAQLALAGEPSDQGMEDIALTSTEVSKGDPQERVQISNSDHDDNGDEDDDIDMLDDESDNADATTENSIVKIDRKKLPEHETLPDDADEDEPDVYDVNVLAWDAPVSALHLAIANGHMDVVKVLVQDFGADVLLPIKLVNDYNKNPRAAILPVVLALQLTPEKAKAMTNLLIDLGASPAQADVEHITALNYFAAHGAELLSFMISANQPAAHRAVNHLSMSGYQYNPTAKGALHTAIEHCDLASVDALLELGAKAEIDYATYVTSYKSKWDVTGDAEHNKQQFRQNFEQPIFAAVRSEISALVVKLLDAGANINSLKPAAWRATVQSHQYNNNDMHSLLDAVRDKLDGMRSFIETGKVPNTGYNHAYNSGRSTRFAPVPLQDDSEYLQGLEEGSYAHWSVTHQIEQAKTTYSNDLKAHEAWLNIDKEPRGTREKTDAVRSLITDFEALESKLVERGAKTFKELYPDVKLQEHQAYSGYNYEPDPPKPWKPLLSFLVPDLTDERRAGYSKLFQACWSADLSAIKELTLTVWEKTQTPLKIAVTDTSGYSPFSIAVLRKHIDVARAVLEIAHAQYAPEENKGQAKHSIQALSEDDDESSQSDEDDIQIYSEIVDDRFTVENIGEIQHQVKSNVTPLQMISWNCPVHRFLEDDDPSVPSYVPSTSTFGMRSNRWAPRRQVRAPRKILKDAANGRTYHVQSQPAQEQLPEVTKPGNLFQFAIYLDVAELLQLLLAFGENYTVRKTEVVNGTPAKFFRFSEADFLYAIQLGRIQLLEDIIKRTGAGLPLDELIKKSGIEIVEKPKYYQGLSVHGKKRADWANAGRETQIESAGDQHPPLLHAARLGSLESVEWFESDATLRCYSQFAKDHKDDKRIENLAKAKGGIEASITKWLSLRSQILLHCVVLGKTTKESLHLLRHLCKTHPEAVHHRSANGNTPLQLAFTLHRIEMIKVLIEADADQTCRNFAGSNIVHSMLGSNFVDVDKDLDDIRAMFSLIDGRLLASLFTERTTERPGAATPLARWIRNSVGTYVTYNTSNTTNTDREKFVQLFLEFSKGEDLDIVTGEGDTPLHAAVRHGADAILRVMLECRPELLYRENATGRTPYEMAEDAYLAKEVFNDPPSIAATTEIYYNGGGRRRLRGRGRRDATNALTRQPETFVDEPKDLRSDVEKVWDVCKEFAAKAQGTKRKLVSLVEANEVAKRLAVRKGSRDQGGDDEQKDNDDDVKGDEVDVWLHMGFTADQEIRGRGGHALEDYQRQLQA